MINKSDSVPHDTPDIELFLKLGLIKVGEKWKDESLFQLTIDGEEVLSEARIM